MTTVPIITGAYFLGGVTPRVSPDFSARIKSCTISTGRTKADPKTFCAPAGKVVLVVRNEDQVFSANSGSAFASAYVHLRQPAQISIQVPGKSAHVGFCGYCTRIAPVSGVRGSKDCTLEFTDLIGMLSTFKPSIPLLINRPASHGVAAVINTALGAPYAYLTVNGVSTPTPAGTIQITDGGGYVSTWTITASSAGANQIRATSAADFQANLIAMINQTTGVGTLYGSAIAQNYPNGLVASAVASSTNVTVTSAIPGQTGAAFSFQLSGLGSTVTLTSSGGTTTNPVAATSVDLPSASTTPYWMEGNITIDTGIAILPYIGVGWDNTNTQTGPTALSMIEDLTRNENGAFYVQQGGGVFWRNRNYKFMVLPNANADAFTGQPTTVAEKLDADVYGQIVLTVTPKDSLASGVVAKNSSAVQVPGNNTKMIHLPFTDPATGQRMGATQLVLPLVGHVDYYATEQSNGTGVDYSVGAIAANLTHTYVVTGSGIDITFVNTATGTLYVTQLQVRGVGLVSYNPSSISAPAVVTPSFTNPAPNTLTIDMSLSNDVNYSTSLANYLYTRYGTELFRIKTVDFANMLVLNAGDTTRFQYSDILSISDSQNGETGRYWIEGSKISYNKAASTMVVTYTVEKLDDQQYWLLGDATYGVLGSTTRLAI